MIMRMTKSAAKVIYPIGFVNSLWYLYMRIGMMTLAQETLVIWNWFLPEEKIHPSSGSFLKVPKPRQ